MQDSRRQPFYSIGSEAGRYVLLLQECTLPLPETLYLPLGSDSYTMKEQTGISVRCSAKQPMLRVPALGGTSKASTGSTRMKQKAHQQFTGNEYSSECHTVTMCVNLSSSCV